MTRPNRKSSAIRRCALAVALAATAIGALVVVTREPDPADAPAIVPRPALPPPPSTGVPARAAVVPASPPAAPSASVAPTAATGSNRGSAARDALRTLWPVATSPNLVGLVPPGPYATLDDVCTARDKSGDDCRVAEQDVESGPFAKLGSVKVFEPVPETDVMGQPGNRTEYVAVQAATGWFVMPFTELVLLNRAGFNTTAEPAGDALVIRYTESVGNRWDEDDEDGVVVCKPVDRVVACTPRIPLHERNDSIATTAPDWTWNTTISLACRASYADGAVTVAPMRKADASDPDGWTAEAAASCTQLPYAGKRSIRF